MLPAALHPAHGTLVANIHSGDRPGLGAALLQRLRSEPGLLFKPESPEGREVLRVARLYRCADCFFLPLFIMSAGAVHTDCVGLDDAGTPWAEWPM